MAFRNASRDEVSSGGGAFQDASRGILRMSGGWGNVSGPDIFMVRTIFTGTLSAVTMGIVGGSFGAVIWGTASLPFLVAACGGFVFGAVQCYRDAVRQSLISLDRYPTLMQLHLDENYPWRGWDRYRREELTRRHFDESWVRKGMLVCAWLTAQPALDQINETKESILVEESAKAQARQSTDTRPFENHQQDVK